MQILILAVVISQAVFAVGAPVPTKVNKHPAVHCNAGMNREPIPALALVARNVSHFTLKD